MNYLLIIISSLTVDKSCASKLFVLLIKHQNNLQTIQKCPIARPKQNLQHSSVCVRIIPFVMVMKLLMKKPHTWSAVEVVSLFKSR